LNFFIVVVVVVVVVGMVPWLKTRDRDALYAHIQQKNQCATNKQSAYTHTHTHTHPHTHTRPTNRSRESGDCNDSGRDAAADDDEGKADTRDWTNEEADDEAAAEEADEAEEAKCENDRFKEGTAAKGGRRM
jgi:ABC-type nickel/cobalt efflux system permease component RcnA